MDTLGIVESKSIAAGAALADGMMKAATVDLVRAGTICSGRFLIFVSGDRQSVDTAVAFARHSTYALAGEAVLSPISPPVLAVLHKSLPSQEGEALGIVECRTVTAGISAADGAVKRAMVRLLRLSTGQGINGKSYFVLGGDVAAVEDAVAQARAFLGKRLVETVVLPRPEARVAQALTGR